MSERHITIPYPFTAIVGQDKMKLALILNTVNPSVGGVLIRGERGTAKSTAVRSLANLLPEYNSIMGCPFNCNPYEPESMCSSCRQSDTALRTVKRKMRVVELPVSATEDKVIGTLDISAAIKEGKKKFEPGILAEANRNILYVDEVNLLNDHIVDVLLDSAAMGINTVEREGISFSHPSRFILIGTMNPEEGDLRPQLLDRFGLCVNVDGISDSDERLEIIKRRMDFEKDPSAFSEEWNDSEEKIKTKIECAREILPSVTIDDILLRKIVDLCVSLSIDGHRGDLSMMKASRTLAAFYGRTAVKESDICDVADMVLIHRMRKTPFSDVGVESSKIDMILKGRPEEDR